MGTTNGTTDRKESWKAKVRRSNIDRLTTGKHTDEDVVFWMVQKIAWMEIRRIRKTYDHDRRTKGPDKSIGVRMCGEIRTLMGTCSNGMRARVNEYLAQIRQTIQNRNVLFSKKDVHYNTPAHVHKRNHEIHYRLTHYILRGVLRRALQGTPWEKIEIRIELGSATPRASVLQYPPVGPKTYGRDHVGRPYALVVCVSGFWWDHVHSKGRTYTKDGGIVLFPYNGERVRHDQAINLSIKETGIGVTVDRANIDDRGVLRGKTKANLTSE